MCVIFLYVFQYISHLRNWFFLIDSSQSLLIFFAQSLCACVRLAAFDALFFLSFADYLWCIYNILDLLCFVVKNSNNYGKKKEKPHQAEMVEILFCFCSLFAFLFVSVAWLFRCIFHFCFGCTVQLLHFLSTSDENTVTVFILCRLLFFLFLFCFRFALFLVVYVLCTSFFFYCFGWFLCVFPHFSLSRDRKSFARVHTRHRHYRTRYKMRLTECGCRSLLSLVNCMRHTIYTLNCFFCLTLSLPNR